MAKYNPFRPGSVISPGMFAGRLPEIKTIEQSLFQTKNENPHHFIIEGERGIGKSSLMLYLDYVAKGMIEFDDDKYLNFLVVNVELRASMGYNDVVDEIILELRRQIAEKQAVIELCKKAWEFLSKFQVYGVKYDKGQQPERGRRLDELTTVLADLMADAGNSIDGVVILIDEADKPGSEANLGELCKLLTERLSRKDSNRVCIGLAGLPDVLGKLKASHDSSPRIFKVLTLEPLTEDECARVIDGCLEEAERKNGFKTEITPQAKTVLATLSEGYPHFLHEFGYCAFADDEDNDRRVGRDRWCV